MSTTETVRLTIDSINSGIYVGMVVLDADELDALGDDDLAEVERALRLVRGRAELDGDGDLVVCEVAA